MQSPEDLGRISCALELIRELKARKSGPANPGEIMFCLEGLGETEYMKFYIFCSTFYAPKIKQHQG